MIKDRNANHNNSQCMDFGENGYNYRGITAKKEGV